MFDDGWRVLAEPPEDTATTGAYDEDRDQQN